MQTRRQWHVGVEAPTAWELDVKIAAADQEARDRGYVRKSAARRDFGAMGYAEALVYEEAAAGSDVAARAEMLGTRSRGMPDRVVLGFLVVAGVVLVILAANGAFDFMWRP